MKRSRKAQNSVLKSQVPGKCWALKMVHHMLLLRFVLVEFLAPWRAAQKQWKCMLVWSNDNSEWFNKNECQCWSSG
jgi:hypothetical protein